MSVLGTIAGIAAGTAGTAYDYLTPGSGSSHVTDLGANSLNPNVDLYGRPHGVVSQVQTYGTPATWGTGAGGQAGGDVPSASTQTDPYAQYGGKAAYDAQVANFGTQKQNISGSANDAAGNYGIGLGSSILDLIQSGQSGQRAIDERGIQNELAKKQGTQGVLGMVGRGIRSGGVMLANRNAGDSSAAGAIARAYGDIGRRELSNVGNQYETENRGIGIAQTDLGEQLAGGARKIGEGKQQFVNNLVLDARNKFAQLDDQAAQASLPERIQIEQEKESVRQQVLQVLSKYDQQLSQGVAGIQPTSVDQRRSTANELAMAGQAPADSFSYNDQAPAQFANSGPFASELPLFTFPRGRRTA